MNHLNQLISFANNISERIRIDYGLFLSLGTKSEKARVYYFKNLSDLKTQLSHTYVSYVKEVGSDETWIKIDIITKTLSIEFQELRKQLIEMRRNYIDFGFTLDSDYELAFIPEEINANAFVRPKRDDKSVFYLSEVNINNYLTKYRATEKRYSRKLFNNKIVTQFFTKSYFLVGENIYELEESGYEKGLRKVDDLHKEIDCMIDSSVHFLEGEIEDNGKYIYGYFPHFDNTIGFYNNLRHSSATYSLIEGLSYMGESIKPAKKPIEYIINNYLYEKDGAGYIFDDTNSSNEIKLGQNAAFIFAVCEYLKHKENADYLKAAQLVARGTVKMIDENGRTVHVLDYPSLEVKERHRVIYYDGEAALGLLRLYQIDKNSLWLQTVKCLFEKFIRGNYWKYHDHWLGYCANEMVNIVPDKRYFELGIRNVALNLPYIYQRETTFPTFLEMLMSSYYLVQKAKASGHKELVNRLIDEDFLLKTIHHRADYQRTGYFYPEIAMYFKNPARILGAFFIKHHGYRVRIDDIEHYVSGYIQYQKTFKRD